jgi:membrane protein DedA with SNARE-associated domain
VETVLGWLIQYEYVAMFSILLLCGVGLPLPEEVTLLGSGLLVGWREANFWLASLACCCGILAGDSVIFGLGHRFGGRFLLWRPMRMVLTPSRQQHVQTFFLKHGSKALFLARFFPGVRIGVYAYAGSQRISWRRFLTLDGAGVAISGPASVAVGRWAGRQFANDREQAIEVASERLHWLGHWLTAGLLLAVAGAVAWQAWRHARGNRTSSHEANARQPRGTEKL